MRRLSFALCTIPCGLKEIGEAQINLIVILAVRPARIDIQLRPELGPAIPGADGCIEYQCAGDTGAVSLGPAEIVVASRIELYHSKGKLGDLQVGKKRDVLIEAIAHTGTRERHRDGIAQIAEQRPPEVSLRSPLSLFQGSYISGRSTGTCHNSKQSQ